MKKTLVVSGFPGVGKSEFVKQNKSALDLDSESFTWLTDEDGKRVRNQTFPNNYIKHIWDNLGKVDYILVSSHGAVREALAENQIDYTMVFPDYTLKQEYLKRYKDRGNDESFLRLMENEFDNFVKGMYADVNGEQLVFIEEGTYLTMVEDILLEDDEHLVTIK